MQHLGQLLDRAEARCGLAGLKVLRRWPGDFVSLMQMQHACLHLARLHNLELRLVMRWQLKDSDANRPLWRVRDQELSLGFPQQSKA